MQALKNEKGQSTSEYILIIVLVAIAVVIALHLFGSQVKDKFFGAGQQMQNPSLTEVNRPGDGKNNSSPEQTGLPSGKKNETQINDDDGEPKFFGDEDAIRVFEEERQKAWLKTILVFAVAGAVLLMLIFMTIERIRMIKKQIRAQQDSDDFRRGPRSRKPIAFKKSMKMKDD
jgi:Flp pilus assembly pilin Flp